METLESCSLNFPPALNRIPTPPRKLYCHGDLQSLNKPLVSIIGAREMRPWVSEWMENELSPVLCKLNIGLVSGGARGVDQKAHVLAIRSGRPTVIVIPSGLNKIYPANISSWKQNPQVCFVSEYEKNQSMRKHHFFYRNRIIVGLSSLTLVVQAKERSGSMMSARMAIEQGKTVATIPASPMDSAFLGNNQLLYEGAQMVRNKEDFMTLVLNEVVGSKILEKEMESDNDKR